MDHDYFSYFLTISSTPFPERQISEEEHQIKLLCDAVKQTEVLRDLECDTTNDTHEIVLSLPEGTTEEINRNDLEEALHNLALRYPDYAFNLCATNEDHRDEEYEIQFHGDLYQESNLYSRMPNLSQPVAFEDRNVSGHLSPQDAIDALLNKTDFNLLYQQKKALLKNLAFSAALSPAVVNDLLNLLDAVGNLAEAEGRFTTNPQLPARCDVTGRENAPHNQKKLTEKITEAAARSNSQKQHPGKSGEFAK